MNNNEILLKIEGSNNLTAYFRDENVIWSAVWDRHDKALVWTNLNFDTDDDIPDFEKLTFLKFGCYVPGTEVLGENFEALEKAFSEHICGLKEEFQKDLFN